MAILNQLIKMKTRLQKKRRTMVLRLQACPQKRGICAEIRNSVSPKKPNSAKRKVAKVRITSTGRYLIAAIPGQGHNLQKYSSVLIRGGRVRDVPGVRFKLIKGKYDFNFYESGLENSLRRRRRSKYGIPKKIL